MKSRALALTTAGILAATAVAASPVSAGPATWALPDSGTAQAAGRPTTPYAPPGAVTTDGVVFELARVGDEVVASGYFSRIGRYVGAGLAVDATTGQRRPFPQVSDRMISVAVPDGAGGFYAGGYFDKADDQRRDNLVHVLADGSVDRAFDVRVDGYVYALALTGSTLHVGGDFDRVGGLRRSNLAAVDVGTGAVTSFAHRSGQVTELAVAPAAGDRAARLYVSNGDLVALDPVTGARDTTFVPAVPRRPKYEIAVAGDRVLLGYNGMVALDADTGAVDPAFATGGIGPVGRDSDDAVSSLTVDGARLLVGGRFSTLGGGTGPLAAYDLVTGDPDPAFAPAFGPAARVHDVAVADDRLWVGGRFGTVSGRSAGNVAALDAATGARLTVDEPVVDDTVNAVDVSGETLAVGGAFAIVDPVDADGYARLDAATLQPIAGGRSGPPPYDLLVDSGVLHQVYDDGVTARAPRTGAVLPGRSHGLRNLVAAAVGGGRLVTVQDSSPNREFGTHVISMFSTRTGARLRRGTLRLPGYVTDVRVLGSTALVSGSFTRVRPNGQQANLALLKWSPKRGRVLNSFDPFLNGPVYDISDSGPVVVTGSFDAATYGPGGRDPHRGVARIDPRTGTVSPVFGGPDAVRGTYDTTIMSIDPSLVALSGRPSYTNPFTTFADTTTGARRPDPTQGFGRRAREFVRLPGGRTGYVTIGTVDTFNVGGRALIAQTTAP